MTDQDRLDLTRDNTGDRSAAGRRRQYLPSAQVVHELASVGDLSKLADELRQRLTDSAPDSMPC
ncbi:MAG TPA: hypothetical protein VLM11_23950 [Streptosporangiaceae bacterium]|nr:hypothetical protein [Streptosporangiaceae bacterium]